MGDSCSICGLILAPNDSDYPGWCKDIRALCCINSHPILSGNGYIDEDAIPYLLPVPALNRFCIRRTVDMDEDSCYPFHAACWTILEEVAQKKLLVNSIETLFRIFESCHYYRDARALNWGHDYYLEDILNPRSNDEDRGYSQHGLVAAYESNPTILADPLLFNFKEVVPSRRKPSRVQPSHSASCCGLLSLPNEILHSIMCNLSFRDITHLLQTCRQYNGDFCHLPLIFWEDRFRVYGETGFARSIHHPGLGSWQDWFFRIQSEIRDGPNKMSLRNRKRIWRLAINLIDLIQTIEEPGRVLRGDLVPRIPAQRPSSTVSCLALKYDIGGCREQMQRYAYWGERPAGSELCAVTPSYVFVSNRRLVSGLIFTFSDGKSVDIGYIVGRQSGHLNPAISPKFLWLVSSSLGIETVALDVYPHSLLDRSSGVAISKWRLENLRGISLGLDAIRIVRMSQHFRKSNILENVLWTPPYPSPIPSMHDEDITALHNLQSESFAPASTLYIKPENGRVVAIKIYAPLGLNTGITGIRFVYDTGIESMWGSDYDAASLSFFLDGREHIVNVKVYKVDSLVCHLQFTTDLSRTSDLLPQLPMKSNISFECVEYRASNGGYIVGFCGCYVNSSQQLNCFGVIPTTTVAFSKSTWSRPVNYAFNLSETTPPQMPLGQIKKHGEFKSQLLLKRRPQSIQASINTVMTKYRCTGQVTGLLFRSGNEKSHPDLLGQWTGAGETYDLEEDEWIVDLVVTKTKPRCVPVARPGLSQVKGITVVTNRRRMEWGSGTAQVCDISDADRCEQNISEVTWDFNAIFDRVQWAYYTD